MKKYLSIFVLLIIISTLLIACSNITQDDYDRLERELSELKKENRNLRDEIKELRDESHNEYTDNNSNNNKTDYISNIVGNQVGIQSPADFEGAKIAVQDETTADESISAMIAEGMDIDVIRFPTIMEGFNDLKTGRVDALYVDSIVAAFYTTGNDDYQRVWLSDEQESLGICLAKNSVNLRNAIDSAVSMLYYNGIMAELGKKHFGDSFDTPRSVTTEPTLIPVNDDDLRTPGKLMIGVEVGYPPMEYFAADGTTMVGFDIDVGNAIADILGLEAEFINTSWYGIFAGLNRGDYDCIISSVSITEERLENFLFTAPYIANALCIIIRK